jgi:homoserine dehydrogenase
MKTVNIGMLGLGIVGSGVYELLRENADLVALKSGIR